MIDFSGVQFLYFDAFLNILGIIGTWPAIKRLWSSRSPTPLESKLKWILISFSAMMLVRIPYVAFDAKEIGPVVYLCAVMAAYFVFLYLETLMRKHLPLFVKIYMLVGSSYFIFLAFSKKLARHTDNLLSFALFISSMAVLALFITFFRKRSEHSRVENSLIDQFGITLILLMPLMLTDIFSYGIPNLPRFGVCGILMLTYFSLYNQAIFSTRSTIFKKMLKAVGFALLLTVGIGVLLQGVHIDQWSLETQGRAFAFLFAVNLIFRIHFAVRHLDGNEELAEFIKVLSQSKKSTIGSFLNDLNSFFGNMDRMLLSCEDLKSYDVQTISQLMSKNPSSVYSFFELKEMIAQNEETKMLGPHEVHAVEQMVHLLEKYEMTYFSQFGSRKPYFLLFSVPMVAYREMIDVRTKIIHDVSLLIEKQSEKA